MYLAVGIAAWLVVAATVTLVMRARGHDTFSWGFLSIVLGPLAIPLAVSAHRHRPAEAESQSRPGPLDVLVAVDGSAQSTAAVEAALGLIGRSASSVTLITVLDLEATTTVRGRGAEQTARARLDDLARQLAERVPVQVDTAVLHGNPVKCLEQFAVEHGYELIVAASRGHGVSKGLMGRVAQRLAATSPVPVLFGPGA